MVGRSELKAVILRLYFGRQAVLSACSPQLAELRCTAVSYVEEKAYGASCREASRISRNSRPSPIRIRLTDIISILCLTVAPLPDPLPSARRLRSRPH